MKEFIIDVNVDVSRSNAEYPYYFLDDLRQKKVRVVYGGSAYKSEVMRSRKLVDFFNTLLQSGLLRKVSCKDVDEREADLVARIIAQLGSCPKECDDPHIFALAHISGCLNIVTKDKRMGKCRDKVRRRVGHDHFPNIRLITTEAAYRDS